MKSKKIAQLISGFILTVLLGLIYAWSIFAIPLEKVFGWSRADTSLIFSISMVFFCIGNIAGGFILKKDKPRINLLICSACMLIGFIIASRTNSLMTLYLSYGVLCGFGTGIGYNVILSTVVKWYPDKTGFCSGVLLMGLGIGGMLLGAQVTHLINTVGWRNTFMLLGIVFSLIIAIGSLIISNPPKNLFSSINVNKKRSPEEGLELTSAQMLKRPSFWLCFIWAMVLSASGLSVIGHASPCAIEVGATAASAVTAVGVISICNGAGRIVFGSLFDLLGRKKTMIAATIVFMAAMVLLVGSIMQKSFALLIIGYILIGLGYGGTPSICVTYVGYMYGPKSYPLNISFMVANIIPAALLGPLLAGTMQTATGSYLSIFVLLFGLNIIAVLFAALIKRP